MFKKIKTSLQRTRDNFTTKVTPFFASKKALDTTLLKELETDLILADTGVTVARNIIIQLTKQVKTLNITDAAQLLPLLKQELVAILTSSQQPLIINDATKPLVILVAGINGSGKTTTIGKLAWHFKQQGKKVLLAAADTFRAAAIEQLKIWGERNQVPVIAQQLGSDSASVAYDALDAAKARNIDVLIIDTAGRLHTQANLMAELQKIKHVLKKRDADAPHEVLLTLDATIGQNALNQAKEFNEAIGVTGLILTKLDGTAKGGIIFAITQELKLPIRFIGVGEAIEDLEPFNAKDFVEALFA